MNHSRTALAAVLLHVASAALLAQAERGIDFEKLRTPIHRAAADLTDRPGLWAAGAGYKVLFDGGLNFVPYLGEAASENAVFAWRTIGLGEHELPVTVELRERVVGAFHCEYDLDRLTESYDVLANGLEQTFVLGSEPAGLGDITLRGAVGGNLHAEPRLPAHRAIDFLDGRGRAVVRYGAAVAVEATGQPNELDTSCVGDVVMIHLPRELLHRARYPLVIDPLLAPLTLASGLGTSSTSNSYRSLAIERNDYAPNHNVMVAYTHVASQVDSDVSAFLCDDDFGNAAAVFADLDTSVSSDDADVAFVGNANSWVLVLARSIGTFTGCRYHLHAGSSTTMGNSLTVFSTPSSERETRPRVGGSRRFATGSNALLVRQRDPAATPGNTAATSIWASVLNLAVGAETTPQQVAGGTFVDAEAPAISKDSNSGSWVVAWQSWSGYFATRWQVKARRISQQGVLSTGILSTDHDLADVHQLSPRVDGTDGRYLLAYGEVSRSAYPGRIDGDTFKIGYTMRFDWANNAASPHAMQPSRPFHSSLARDAVMGGVSYDTHTSSHWAVSVSNLTDGITYFAVHGFQGRHVYAHALYLPSGANEGSNWSAICFDDDNQRFLAVFAQHNPTGGGLFYDNSVVGRRFDYPQTRSVVLGSGCSSANIGNTASFQVGNEFAGVWLGGGPANMPAILVMSLQTTNIPMDILGMTGCLLQVDPGIGSYVSVGTVIDAYGSAVVPIPLSETLSPQNLWFQWLHLAPGTNPAQIQMTGGMRVEMR